MPEPFWAPLLEYASGIKSRHLITDEEMKSAKQCLYRVYHMEQGWNPGPDPSNLRIEEDRFEDDVDAEWFGLYSEEKLVGVGRVVNGLESALYLSQEKRERVLEAVNPSGQLRVCELNRTAILPEYRGSLAMMLIAAYGRYYSKNC